MAMNPRSYALSQISSLVANVTKKNYKANCSEIAKVWKGFCAKNSNFMACGLINAHQHNTLVRKCCTVSVV